MTKDQEYRERHLFWTDKTLVQFGAANNFFILVGIGILGYILKILERYNNLYPTICNMDWRITLLCFSAFAAFLSVIFGALTLLSRLHDLRITRHINWIRIKINKKEYEFIEQVDDYIDIKGYSLLLNFISTLSGRKYYIDDADITKEEFVKIKFNNLRKRTLLLGRFSWKCFNYQIFIVLLSVFLYLIFWLF